MKNTAIILKWVEGGIEHRNEIIRDEFYAEFEELIKEYPDNSEISKKLVKIIPEMDEISINKDANGTKEIPFIVYLIEGKKHMLKIMRWHKIVWGRLHDYCK